MGAQAQASTTEVEVMRMLTVTLLYGWALVMESHLAARSGLQVMCWVAQAATSEAETRCLTFWRPKVQNQGVLSAGSSEGGEGEPFPGLLASGSHWQFGVCCLQIHLCFLPSFHMASPYEYISMQKSPFHKTPGILELDPGY